MGTVRTAFEPAVHGFHFPNAFSTTLLPALGWGPLRTPTVALGGLCGGMTFAALDRYFAGRAAPTHRAADYPPPGVPRVGSRLHEEIMRRHLESVGLVPAERGVPVPGQEMHVQPGDLHNLVTYPRLRLASTATLADRVAKELSRAAQSLSGGDPVPLGLVAEGSLFRSHQVVAIGMDDTEPGCTRLYLYDCRNPDVTATLAVTPSSALCMLEVEGSPPESWRAFFVEHYEWRAPQYTDLALATPLAVTDGIARFAMRNVGEADAHAESMTLHGADAPRQAVGVVAPGATVQYEQPVPSGAETGVPAFVDSSGNEFALPAA